MLVSIKTVVPTNYCPVKKYPVSAGLTDLYMMTWPSQHLILYTATYVCSGISTGDRFDGLRLNFWVFELTFVFLTLTTLFLLEVDLQVFHCLRKWSKILPTILFLLSVFCCCSLISWISIFGVFLFLAGARYLFCFS